MIVAPNLWRSLSRPPCLVVPILLAALAVGPVHGQFAAHTELVEVYASVTGANGQPVDGLPREAFRVFEDGLPQRIVAFAGADLQLTLVVAVDHSFSMRGPKLAAARAGADRLIDDLQPSDRVMVVAIGSQVETLAALGGDRAAAREAVRGLMPWGTTPLGEAVSASIRAVASAAGRRAVVLFTDGETRYDTEARSAVLNTVRRGDVIVYPVGVGHGHALLLAELADVSGGRSIDALTPAAASRAATAIASELRHQYLLGYEPPAPQSALERWRTIRVDVEVPGAKVLARQGYYGRGRQGGGVP